MDVRWGDISVVDAEFALFDEAYRRGEYSYYHLLSGVDMPLKTQNYIHRFLKKCGKRVCWLLSGKYIQRN